MVYKILDLIAVFLALLIVLPVHEFAHGFAAVKNGDLTPKLYNRYTLNPLAHFDPIGLVCFVLVHFGWAKPMPVNPNNYKNYKRGCFSVAIAGVLANYILAFIAFPLWILSCYLPSFGYFTLVLNSMLYYIFWLSIVFFVFNIIPVYPLDGFRIVETFNKKRGKVFRFLRYYGIYVLYALFLLGIIADVIDYPAINILGRAISFVAGWVSKPITLFWGLVF